MTMRINTIIATPMKTAKITDCMSARFVQMLVFWHESPIMVVFSFELAK